MDTLEDIELLGERIEGYSNHLKDFLKSIKSTNSIEEMNARLSAVRHFQTEINNEAGKLIAHCGDLINSFTSLTLDIYWSNVIGECRCSMEGYETRSIWNNCFDLIIYHFDVVKFIEGLGIATILHNVKMSNTSKDFTDEDKKHIQAFNKILKTQYGTDNPGILYWIIHTKIEYKLCRRICDYLKGIQKINIQAQTSFSTLVKTVCFYTALQNEKTMIIQNAHFRHLKLNAEGELHTEKTELMQYTNNEIRDIQNQQDDEHTSVFISYSRDNEEHNQWVIKLSTHLRYYGVNAILDHWFARDGSDLTHFMEQGLSQSNLILCICSDTYVQKANEGKGGVGYEKRIISADMMNSSTKNYIIPIKRSVKSDLPIFLKGIKYIDFSEDEKYVASLWELLSRIYNEDIKMIPPLGKNPFRDLYISQQISNNTILGEIKYRNDAFSGTVTFDFSNNNGDFIIGEGDYMFITHWSAAGQGSIHCYKDKVKRLGYNPSYTEFPSMKDLPNFDFSSRVRTIKEGEIVILENDCNKFVALKVTKVFRNSVDSGHLLEFQYKVYNGLEPELFVTD